MVLIDLAHLKNIFASHGIQATMVLDGVVAIRICHNPKELLEGVFWISERLFARIAFEFLSLEWFAEEFSLPSKEAPETVTAEELETMNGVRDCSLLRRISSLTRSVSPENLALDLPIVVSLMLALILKRRFIWNFVSRT